MANMNGDIRNAVRALLRTPAVTISAVVCIALGIGATTAISSAVSRALLRELPFADPGRVVAVHRVTPSSGPEGTWPSSVPNYRDLAARTKQLSNLSAIWSSSALVMMGSEAQRLPQVLVTGNLFSMLGVRAERGRLIGPDDDRVAAERVAVISDRLWRIDLGSDTAIIGRKMIIDGAPTTVVGVLQPPFEIQVINGVFRGDIWMPIRFTAEQMSEGNRRSNFLTLVGRLAPNATVESARSEIQTLFAGIVATNPQLKGESTRVVALASDSVKNIRTPLLLLFGAVCMVLLIAATNVAALLLARGVERRRETAVRVALGGSRGDVMRPVFIESLLLAIAGAFFGVFLAALGARSIGVLAATRMPQLSGLSLDGRVLTFAVVLAVGVGMLCAFVPAWRTANVDPQDVLRSGRGGGTGREQARSLRALVVAEIGLSLVLLIGAGLVLKAFASLVSSDPGFNPTRILTLRATLSPASYKDRLAETAFITPAASAIAAIPGVEAVGAITVTPYINWGNNFNIRYEGQPGDQPARLPIAEYRVVTPGFFAVTEQRLVSGRLLQTSDIAKALPVAVVNQALVKRDFKNENPIGKRFYLGDTTFATIVGVVSDIRNAGPFSKPMAEIYLTYEQGASGSTSFPIMVRTSNAPPTSVTSAVRAAIQSVDPTAAVTDFRSMTDVIDRSLGTPKFYLAMLGAFAAVAVVLAVAGLYGMLSYTVAQRTRELGIRAALGGSRATLIRLVSAQGLQLVAAGLVIGLIGGWATTRLMTFMLYGVSPLDPVAWIVSCVLLALAGAAATVIPAMRAARVDPLLAIRAE